MSLCVQNLQTGLPSSHIYTCVYLKANEEGTGHQFKSVNHEHNHPVSKVHVCPLPISYYTLPLHSRFNLVPLQVILRILITSLW